MKNISLRGIFIQYKFPYDQSDPALWKLATHVINEGNIHKITAQVQYVNKDPMLHLLFKKRVVESEGVYTGTHLKRDEKVYVSYAKADIGRRLMMIGVPKGDKTTNQPTIDLSKMPDDIWRYHMQTTLTEEGFLQIGIDKRKDTLTVHIGWRRATDITDQLTKDLISTLEPGTYNLTQLKELGEDILEVIYRNPPVLLEKERDELIKRHIREISPWLWPNILPTNLIVRTDYRIRVNWIFTVSRARIVDLLYNRYGFIKGSWKYIAAQQRYDFYIKHRGRKLREEQINEFNEIRNKYPYKISRNWMKKRFKELFGETA